MFEGVSKENPVIAWWSGGVASAVTCKLCIDWFGIEFVKIVFIDTHNEHPDTYSFLKECELWYGCNIRTIASTKHTDIRDVWYDNLSLNIAKGAKCSEVMKITVRQQYIKQQQFSYQAFGFDITEIGRAKDMKKSNSHLNPIFPLIYKLFDKKDCMRMIQKANDLSVKINIPESYQMGYSNNNCFQTGCVKGGIGYWQKIKHDYPEKFSAMAKIEHDLTDLKGMPVTICKDQSKEAKARNGGRDELVFLLPNPKYPLMKDISMIKGRQPESLIECNGFCGQEIVNPVKELQ